MYWPDLGSTWEETRGTSRCDDRSNGQERQLLASGHNQMSNNHLRESLRDTMLYYSIRKRGIHFACRNIREPG
ncbi:hypothetical protein RB195_016378 [Necator americanus]|uniref:Uncharacterized protein n=1 Tax=Necator americanus TaxID=51031 RepID=A0ABR1E8V5_NECAM